jgi:hypothetical protein
MTYLVNGLFAGQLIFCELLQGHVQSLETDESQATINV